jgi:hypothetical protein
MADEMDEADAGYALRIKNGKCGSGSGRPFPRMEIHGDAYSPTHPTRATMIPPFVFPLLFAGLLWQPAQAAPLYKWTDSTGRVTYSSLPPPAGARARTIEIPPQPSAEEARQAQERAQRTQEQASEMEDRRRKQEEKEAEEARLRAMQTPPAGDKTFTLFRDVVSALLNNIVGNTIDCVESYKLLAQEWLADHPVGSGVAASSAAWKEAEPWHLALDDYNNGLLCAPSREEVRHSRQSRSSLDGCSGRTREGSWDCRNSSRLGYSPPAR